jgi:hypothetical protein
VVDITEPERAAAAHALRQLRQPCGDVGQVDQRHDRAIDQIHGPETDRDNRLDVQYVRDIIVRPDAEEGVVVERHADHRRDRVLRRLGEIPGFLRERRRCRPQGHDQRKRESRLATEHINSCLAEDPRWFKSAQRCR